MAGAADRMTRVVAWMVEGTWPACVDAIAALAPDPAEVTLVHAGAGEAVAVAGSALSGLLGRRPQPELVVELGERERAAAEALLDAAAARLGRPAQKLVLEGRIEHAVLEAARGADLLVVSRDDSRPGPHGLAGPTRFVVDHAPCPLLVVTPREGEHAPPRPRPRPRPRG
jgi:nucleotide-binding universal stress UspA family protein